jgi:hypothetical protein
MRTIILGGIGIGLAVSAWAGGEECTKAAKAAQEAEDAKKAQAAPFDKVPCCADIAKAQMRQMLRKAGVPDCSAEPPAADGRFVVHEWGTFTSFAGSDGVSLEFRPTIGADLPDFVYDRAEWTGDGSAIDLEPGKFGMIAHQRMETPVIYFYADQPRNVNVRVDFPEGLLTEFYPNVHAMHPAYDSKRPEPIQFSFLEWKNLRVVPVDQLASSGERGELGHAPSLPRVDSKDHYGHARDTASAWVRSCRGTGNGHRDEWEKFLFYRGVGNFKLPVSARTEGGGRILLTNTTNLPLSAVFVLSDQCCGASDIHFAQYADLKGEHVLDSPLKNTSVHEVGERIVRALVKTGLYELEARAMVKTWHDSWLAESGLRVLYVLPREWTDQVLPISINPAPDELVRVLVGRIEMMSGTQERDLAESIRKLASGVSSERDTAAEAIKRFGRFAEPALRRAAATTNDTTLQARAAELVKRLTAKS